MNLNIDSEWLLRMAKKEDNAILSVGGLAAKLYPEAFTKPAPLMSVTEWCARFPVKAMRKLQILADGIPDAEALFAFFGVKSPAEWAATWDAVPVAFRQTQLFDAHQEAVIAWVREVEVIASDIPLKKYNESKLLGAMNDLRGLTMKRAEDAFDLAEAMCADVGIAFVISPEIPGTRISGCARWLDNEHALVGLTLRYKTADQLWFTFFHELGHILLHRHVKSLVIDNAADNMGDDVIDSDMQKYEDEANRFARDTLIPPGAYEAFIRRNRFETEDIVNFADAIGIGPGIVVGRLQHDDYLKHFQGVTLKQKLEWNFKED